MTVLTAIGIVVSFAVGVILWWYLNEKDKKKYNIEKIKEVYPKQTGVRLKDAVVFPNGSIVFKYTDGSEKTLSPVKEVDIDTAIWNSSIIPLVLGNLIAQHDEEIRLLQEVTALLSKEINEKITWK